MFTSGFGTAYAASAIDIVKTCNPFVPVIQLLTVAPRRHQEKFKTVMFTILATFVALLLVFLAKDYWTGYSMATAPADAANGLAPSQGEETPVLDHNASAGAALALTGLPKPGVRARRSSLEPASPPVRVGQAEVATIPPGQSDTVYVVKSGDTLTAIARSYATTIRDIKAANNLAFEHLTVGTRLRIPVSKTLIASNGQPILP